MGNRRHGDALTTRLVAESAADVPRTGALAADALDAGALAAGALAAGALVGWVGAVVGRR